MQTHQILDRKGRDVATITPESPVRAAVEQLGTANIGALVVSDDGTTVAGILSERDVVRRLATDGPSLLDQPVSSIMQADVLTCSGTDPVDDLMHRMTEHRIRHLPVLDGDKIVGVISIGDLVNWIISAQTSHIQQLQTYIGGYPE